MQHDDHKVDTHPKQISDILAFVRAQVDADEARARKDLWITERATPGTRDAQYGHNIPSLILADGEPIAHYTGTGHEADAMLGMRFKPDNVADRARKTLAEVAAKRLRLEEIKSMYADDPDDLTAVWKLAVIEALPYASHADYDESWRPLAALAHAEQLTHMPADAILPSDDAA